MQQLFSSKIMLSIQAYVVGFIIILLTYWIYRWRNPRCNGILPPGSSGIPVIGETLELIIPTYSIDIHPFLKKRLRRYGPLFRTNVAGHNMAVSADKEFNRFVFQQEDKHVVRWYMDLFEKVFLVLNEEASPEALNIHKYSRKLVLGHFGAECIKRNLLSEFHDLVERTLHSWSTKEDHIVEVESASVAMYGEISGKHLYSCDPESSKEFTDKLMNISKGTMSFPLNIPGTTYHKCLKDKDEAMKTIGDIVSARIASKGNNTIEDDLLAKMMKELNTDNSQTQKFITQMLFALSFATVQSIPFMLALALKFITENPDALQELIAEHEEILRKRENPGSSVTWEEFKSMTFTLQVINETLRLGNNIPGFLRKVIKEFKYKGYTIPKGWGIMVCHSVVHLDSNIYKDPLKFDPWRWTGVKPQFISENLTPFGEGMKQCAGADYVRASMSIFIHVLVTNYRWSIVEGGDIVQNPVLHFKNGLHISVSKREN